MRADFVDRGFRGAADADGSTTASVASDAAAADDRRFVEGVDDAVEEEDDVDRGDEGTRADDDDARAFVGCFAADAGLGAVASAPLTGSVRSSPLPTGRVGGCSEGVDGVCSSSF